MAKSDYTAHKPLVWLHGEIKTPPWPSEVRIQAGTLLRELQSGQVVEPPKSKPMPSIGSRVHELRMKHSKNEFRIIYRIDADAIVILEAFQKKSQKTPKKVIDACKQRLKAYDELADS